MGNSIEGLQRELKQYRTENANLRKALTEVQKAQTSPEVFTDLDGFGVELRIVRH